MAHVTDEDRKVIAEAAADEKRSVSQFIYLAAMERAKKGRAA